MGVWNKMLYIHTYILTSVCADVLFGWEDLAETPIGKKDDAVFFCSKIKLYSNHLKERCCIKKLQGGI